MPDTYKVFPSIGVARVGNSNEYYLAPETSGGLPIRPVTDTPITQNDLRDSAGNLKRQGARFRVYCYPEGGGAPYEVVPGPGIRIEWTVHLANKKAAWYNFQPIRGEGIYPPSAGLRNAAAPDRALLIIDPGPRTLTSPGQDAFFSRNSNPSGYAMTFPPSNLQPFTIDTLGEIHTDSQGRLIVVGGLGHSGTDLAYPPVKDLDYANNDNWWDDTSDGPVSAKVFLSDSSEGINADPAWVVVTPPAYAPEIEAQITMYDVMFDVAVRYLEYRPDIYQGIAPTGSFVDSYQVNNKEVENLLDRAYPYKWVAPTINCHQFNWNTITPEQKVGYYNMMRSPDDINVHGTGRGLMPMLAGDGSQSSTIGTPEESKYVSFTYTQKFFGQQWSQGQTNSSVPTPNQPDQLTRASLDNCSGAAFGPGIEMTWISRRPEIYMEAFRLKKANYSSSGPLSTAATPLELGLEPGDFTKYMALPWQADFNECYTQSIPRSDNNSTIQTDTLNWWPAQRMLTVYRQDSQGNITPDVAWVGGDDPTNEKTYWHFELNTQMVNDWSGLGFVFNIGTAETPNFVEVQRTLP